jgi:hypothetical protein
MAVDHERFRVDGRSTRHSGGPPHDEPPIGELFRQLSEDATRLIRQEVALGKAELRETGSALARDAGQIGIAAGLGYLGALAATAFLIVGLGTLLANYWLAALIVAVVFLGAGAVLGKRAVTDIRERDLKPTQTIETLRADAEWAKREVAEVRREWKS